MYVKCVALFFLLHQTNCQDIYIYEGCFERLSINDSLQVGKIVNFGNNATVDICLQECISRAAGYAALSVRQICRCASGIDRNKTTSGCSGGCLGETNGRACGGRTARALSIYQIVIVTTSTQSSSFPASSPRISTSTFSTTGSADDRTSTLSTTVLSTSLVTLSSITNKIDTGSTVLTSTPDSKTTDEPVVIPQTPTEDGIDIIPIVIGSVVGFFVLMIVSFVIFCLCHKKRKTNKYGEKLADNEVELNQYSEMEAQNRENQVIRGNVGKNNAAYSEINDEEFSNGNNIYDQATKDDGTYDKLHTQKQHNSKIKQQIVNDDTYDRCPSAKDDDTYNELNVKKPEIMDDTYDHTKNILQENDGTYDEFGVKRELVDDTYDHTKNILQENDGTYDEFGGKRELVDDTYDHTKNIRQEIDGTYDEFGGKSEEENDTYMYDHTKNVRREIDGTYDEFGDGKQEFNNDTYDHSKKYSEGN